MRNFIKRLSILTIGLLGIFSNGHVFASGSDLVNHWAAPQFQEWLNKGIIQGYDDGSLKPNKAISRAEFTALANKAFGFIYELETHYADVPQHAWYYRAIKKGAAAGYIQGYGDGTIKPMQHITREEAAVMLDRILQLEKKNKSDIELRFNDRDSISKWGLAAVEQITAAGYMKGYENGTFKPQNSITRAEAVVMLSRASGEIVHQAGTYGLEKGKTTYSGNVTITAGNVKLINAVIKGDLLLAEAIGEADIILENVVVEGKVHISGGGAHSVHINGNSDMKQVYVNKKTGKIRIVMSDRAKIGTMTLQSDTEMNTDENTTIDHLILNRATRIYGEGNIGLAEINANGVNLERFPKKIRIKDGLKAIVEGKEYPPLPHHQDENIKDTVPTRDSGRSGGGSGSGSSRDDSKVSVTGITLDHPELTLKVGETAALTANVQPSNARNKSVTWSSDDESVAEVTEGIVTAKSAGMATITATTVDGGFTASSQIHVRNGRADVEISASDLPVIELYPFALSVRNAFDEKETKVDGNKRVTVTVEDGDESATIFDNAVLFNQGDASVTPLKVPDSGDYQLIITIEGIWDPIVIPDVEVVHVLESVHRAQTEDELHRALSALGVLHPGEFDSDSIVMENMQAYIDDFAISKPQTATEVQMRVDEVNDRTIAPQFAAGFPAIDELSDTRFDFMLKLNMDGIIYYLVVEDGAIPPTPEEVKAGQPYRGVTLVAAGSKTLILGSYGWGTVLGVSANTKYDIYLVTESARGALSKQPIKLEVTTKPPIPATFVNGYPKIDGLSDVQFNLILQASKAGTAYYIVVPKDASAPTSEQVKLGASYVGASIVAKGSRSVPINSITFGTVMGLLPYTEYDIYAVMEDAATGSLQQEPTKLQVTTLPDQPPGYSPGHPRILTVKEDSVQFRVVMTKRGNVYYMMVEKGVTPPTPQEVKAGTAYQDVIPVKAGSSPNVTQNIVFTMEGLAADTEYLIYIVVESEGGTLIDHPAVLEVTTPPTIPAQFVSGNPSTRHEEEDRFILALNLTRAGTVHYMVVPKDSDMPNAEEVKAGSHYRGITPVAKGTLQVNPYADVLVAGLSPDTEYDIYAVIEDILFGLQSPVKIRAKTIPDSPPVYWDEPHVFDVSDTEFKLQMGITKPGYGYYLVQRAGESPPTSEQVKANPTGIFDLRPVGALWQYVRNLSPETAYDIYVVAETTYGTLQAEPIKLEVTTMEQTDPPEFILDTPTITYVGKDRIDFNYKLNKAGTVHYLFVSPDAQAPTAEQVVAGVSYDGVPIIRSGQVDFIVNDRIPFLYIEGLTPGTTYAIYIVGKGVGAKTTPVVRLEAATKP